MVVYTFLSIRLAKIIEPIDYHAENSGFRSMQHYLGRSRPNPFDPVPKFIKHDSTQLYQSFSNFLYE